LFGTETAGRILLRNSSKTERGNLLAISFPLEVEQGEIIGAAASRDLSPDGCVGLTDSLLKRNSEFRNTPSPTLTTQDATQVV